MTHRSRVLVARGLGTVYGEDLDAAGVEVEVGRVEDERPHIRDEELLGLLFFHVFELEFWEFLRMEAKSGYEYCLLFTN